MNELPFSTFVKQSWLSLILKEGEAYSLELVRFLITESDKLESEMQREREDGHDVISQKR